MLGRDRPSQLTVVRYIFKWCSYYTQTVLLQTAILYAVCTTGRVSFYGITFSSRLCFVICCGICRYNMLWILWVRVAKFWRIETGKLVTICWKLSGRELHQNNSTHTIYCTMLYCGIELNSTDVHYSCTIHNFSSSFICSVFSDILSISICRLIFVRSLVYRKTI